MIPLTKKPISLDGYRLKNSNGVLPRHVYVGEFANGVLSSQLDAGKRVVLTTTIDKKSLELITSDTIDFHPTASGTYLNSVDWAKLQATSPLTVKLYTLRDTWRKIRSGPGIVLLLTAIGALAVAVVAAVFLLIAQASNSVSRTAGFVAF